MAECSWEHCGFIIYLVFSWVFFFWWLSFQKLYCCQFFWCPPHSVWLSHAKSQPTVSKLWSRKFLACGCSTYVGYQRLWPCHRRSVTCGMVWHGYWLNLSHILRVPCVVWQILKFSATVSRLDVVTILSVCWQGSWGTAESGRILVWFMVSVGS